MEDNIEKTITSYKELMTTSEVADYLGLSVWAIRKRVTTGTIPCERLSPKCVRFRKATIDAWLKEPKGE